MTDEELDPTLDEEEAVEGDEVQAGLDDEDDEDDEDGAEEITDQSLLARASNPIAEPPEHIGSLVFASSGEYPYPFKVARPPRFWMEEQTGVLGQAVEAYFDGSKLSAAQLDVIKLYLKQYVERAVLTGNAKVPLLHSKIDRIRNSRDLERFVDEVAELGAEVF